MSNILSSADTNKVDVIIRHFRFLLDYGYSLESKQINNAIDQFVFSKGNANLIKFEYDIREKYLNCEVVFDNQRILIFDYDYAECSYSFDEFDDMKSGIYILYNDIKHLKRFDSIKYIESVSKVYSQYLKKLICDLKKNS